MTREETAERIKIMQAYVDGKRIQYAEDDTDVWHNIDEPDWHSDYDYRIKPKPKYRPFKNVDECWQEMLKHQPFGWIKSKTGGHYSMVTVVGADEKMKSIAISGRHIWPFDETLSNYTFADGTPFGIKEEH